MLEIVDKEIARKIYTIRGMQVMLDRDLAELYGVETRVLNQAVKRNNERFPSEFMFQLTSEELEDWKSQIVISNRELMGLRKLPYVFTEQGVSMLSAVLKSKTAIETSIRIINGFVQMRRFLTENAQLFRRLDTLERHQKETDQQLEQVFQAIEAKTLSPKQGIFFDGQVFDAYVFASDLIRSAKRSIVLIDNYVDESVLTLFSKSAHDIRVTILTRNITKALKLDVEKYNTQYPKIELKRFEHSHDRFLIIDDDRLYHFGASLKDLGKKWFAFSRFDREAFKVLEALESAK